jgi:hypothetical protein
VSVTIRFNLDPLFRRQGEENKRTTAVRLTSGVGLKGKALEPKKRRDGRPLGGRSVLQGIAAGRVSVYPDGFSVLYPANVGLFHRGDKVDQPPRPIVGMSKAEREKFQQQAADEIAKQLTAHLARGAV